MAIKIAGVQLGNISGGPSSLTLEDLADVSVVSPQTGQYLRYNSSVSEWQNSYLDTDVWNYLDSNMTGTNGVSIVYTSPEAISIGLSLSATGDATGTVTSGSLPLTLATVNSNVGTFGSASAVPQITVNAKGLITSVTSIPLGGTAALATSLAGGSTGALPYQAAANTTAFLAAGTTSQVLIGGSSAPAWSSSPAINGTNFSNVPNSALTNSSITLGTTSISLGSSTSTLGGLTTVTSTTFVGSLTGHASLDLPLTGGSMSGTITMDGTHTVTGLPTPTNGSDAATKNYVDASLTGLEWKLSAAAATTANLTATYANGTSGVGATLTNSGAQAALVLDGYTASLNDRILVKNQTTQTQNGIYVVTNTGSVSTNWVLTRSADANTSSNLNNATLYVINGTTLADTGWTQITPNVVIGTGNIIFTQFSGAGTYVAGTGLSLTGNVFANTGVLSITTNTGLSTNVSATGAVTITNTGVTSNVAGTGISIGAATGTSTITNTGVTSLVAGTNVSVSGATGAVTVSVTGTVPTATTATNIAGGAANSIPYQSAANTTVFLAQGTGVLQETAGAPAWTTTPTLTGTNFSGIPNGALTNSSVTIGTTSISLGGTSTTLAGLTSVTSTGFTGSLTGAASLNVLKAGDTMSGNLSISSNTPQLTLAATASGQNALLSFQTGSSTRWNVLKTSTAESGSNIGSDFSISRYDDSGTFIDTPFTITRSTGAAIFRDSLSVTGTITGSLTGAASLNVLKTGDTMTGNLVISATAPFLGLSAVTSNNAGISYQTAGSSRWIVLKNSTAESGSNAGSDFQINRYDDTGTIIDTPFQITRASGLVTMRDSATIAGNLSVTQASGSVIISASAPAAQTASIELAGAGNTVGTSGFLLRQDTASSALLFNRANAAMTFSTNATQQMAITAVGALSFGTTVSNTGTSGQVLVSQGNTTFPTWSSTFTGHASLDLPLTGGTLTGALAILPASGAANLTVGTAASGNASSLFFKTNSLARWQIESDNTAESGSNAGSNFAILAYDDTGTFLSTPLTISRATGAVTLAVSVTSPSVSINGIGTNTSATLTTSTTTANQVVDTKPIATYRAVRYSITVTSGTAYEYTEVYLLHDGTTAYISEINTMLTGAALATFDADISGGNLRLLVTPVNAVTTIKTVSLAMAV